MAFFAIIAAKLVMLIGRITRRNTSSYPGKLALKICPSILGKLSRQVKHGVVAVCGTNGKTTTNNILHTMVKASGSSVICNSLGANMLPGVTTAFLEKCNIFGKINADYACIEVDEISLPVVFRYLKPDYLVITNLFRDQLDRYGEIDKTIRFIEQAIEMLPSAILVLNADDPLVSYIGEQCQNEKVYFGVNERCLQPLDEVKEGRFCLSCGTELSYDYYHYSQLGSYNCQSCGFTRPQLQYAVQNVEMDMGISYDIVSSGESVRIDAPYLGFYNIYNTVAPYIATKLLGLDVSRVNELLLRYQPQVGRMQTFTINGKKVIFNLSKNPVGFNLAVTSLISDPMFKDTVFVLNDNAQDGRDISWIWDVDFERLCDANMRSVTFSGKRSLDMELRFKYAEIPDVVYHNNADIMSAIQHAIQGSGEVLYVLVNYTALFETQSILKHLSAK